MNLHFFTASSFLPSPPYRPFRAKPSIFLAHRRSCRMALLVCLFPTLSHTHHFPFCYEDPSASLGMTRGKSAIYHTWEPTSAPEGQRLAPMYDYPYPRIVMRGEVEKSFLHVGVLAGWLYWFASFPCDLTLTIFPPAMKIPRLRSG